FMQFTGEPRATSRTRRFGGPHRALPFTGSSRPVRSTMTDDPAVLLPGADPDWSYRPEDAGYAGEVSGFNTAITHAPDLVMVPRDPSEVRDAVRWAAAAGTTVAMQASGHGAYLPVAGGVMLNMRAMDSVRID